MEYAATAVTIPTKPISSYHLVVRRNDNFMSLDRERITYECVLERIDPSVKRFDCSVAFIRLTRDCIAPSIGVGIFDDSSIVAGTWLGKVNDRFAQAFTPQMYGLSDKNQSEVSKRARSRGKEKVTSGFNVCT